MRFCLTAPHRKPAGGQVTDECGEVAMAMVQNKCDLLSAGGVGADAAEAMARRLGLRFYRTCVREGLNCDAGTPTTPSLRLQNLFRTPHGLLTCGMACMPTQAAGRQGSCSAAPARRSCTQQFPCEYSCGQTTQKMRVTRRRRVCAMTR